MKTKTLKCMVLASALGFLSAVGATAQAAVIIVEKSPPTIKCTYYAGYVECTKRQGRGYVRYYPYKSVKICTPHGCHWRYCYSGYQGSGCFDYYPR